MIRVHMSVDLNGHHPVLTFRRANSWTVGDDWGLQLFVDDALLAAVQPGAWSYVVDVDLMESPFPSPPQPPYIPTLETP